MGSWVISVIFCFFAEVCENVLPLQPGKFYWLEAKVMEVDGSDDFPCSIGSDFFGFQPFIFSGVYILEKDTEVFVFDKPILIAATMESGAIWSCGLSKIPSWMGSQLARV